MPTNNKTGKRGGQFENKNAEKWTEKLALELGHGMIDWLRPKYEEDKKGKVTDIHSSNFFYEDYVINEKDLYPSVISYLSETFESFSKLQKKAKKIQELKLCSFGLAGSLNPAITCFVLKNHHNYRDRQDIEMTGSLTYELSEKFMPKGKKKKGNEK